MVVTRNHFIEQFAITYGVHCLRRWPRRSKRAPLHLTTCLYEWTGICKGRIAIARPAFGGLMHPVIEELHRVTPKGERPDAKILAGKVYDALEAAGVEVTIAPPNKAHSN